MKNILMGLVTGQTLNKKRIMKNLDAAIETMQNETE